MQSVLLGYSGLSKLTGPQREGLESPLGGCISREDALLRQRALVGIDVHLYLANDHFGHPLVLLLPILVANG